jgi:hypothetical protein
MRGFAREQRIRIPVFSMFSALIPKKSSEIRLFYAVTLL